MKPVILALTFLAMFTRCDANDGAFRVNGNQLIPMYETDISVKKEILSIKRVNNNQAEITVYYEFFNPKESKLLEVGFEAYSPSGDVDHTPSKEGHPYIYSFSVKLNNADIPYHVSIVSDSLYYKNGHYKTMTLKEAENTGDEESAGFFYVYHFRALFKQGINVIQHTYVVDLSSSVIENYSLDYVLTAAKRWANRQIDDFTLQIDMGSFQDLSIDNTFFKDVSEWAITGLGKSIKRQSNAGTGVDNDISEFFVKKGMLIFKKTNFRPAGELHLHSFDYYCYLSEKMSADPSDTTRRKFDYRRDPLPFSIEKQNSLFEAADDQSKKIMRNLPFARRGYVFKSPEIQAYYDRQIWYTRDSTYVPLNSQLNKDEQDWIKKWAGD